MSIPTSTSTNPDVQARIAAARARSRANLEGAVPPPIPGQSLPPAQQTAPTQPVQQVAPVQQTAQPVQQTAPQQPVQQVAPAQQVAQIHEAEPVVVTGLETTNANRQVGPAGGPPASFLSSLFHVPDNEASLVNMASTAFSNAGFSSGWKLNMARLQRGQLSADRERIKDDDVYNAAPIAGRPWSCMIAGYRMGYACFIGEPSTTQGKPPEFSGIIPCPPVYPADVCAEALNEVGDIARAGHYLPKHEKARILDANGGRLRPILQLLCWTEGTGFFGIEESSMPVVSQTLDLIKKNKAETDWFGVIPLVVGVATNVVDRQDLPDTPENADRRSWEEHFLTISPDVGKVGQAVFAAWKNRWATDFAGCRAVVEAFLGGDDYDGVPPEEMHVKLEPLIQGKIQAQEYSKNAAAQRRAEKQASGRR